MNENDSQLISGLMLSAGYESCADATLADVIIINTCCVRESAENRALGYIGSLKKLKQERPDLVICVTGCMAQKTGTSELLIKSYRHVGIITGTFASSRLPRYISEYKATGIPIIDTEERYDGEELTRSKETALAQGKNSWHAKVNINFGCNNFCSYCIVPYVRGRERSRAPVEIIQEVQSLAAGGVREIELLGQNVNSYGKEFTCGQVDFAGLLQSLDRVEGIERIRYMTSHPRDLDQRLVETIVASRHVCRHFHLPVQSGCDRILDLMNRGYTTAKYKEKLAMIRSLCPDAVVTTDLIVGFPGETEDGFRQTLDFVSECCFDAAYTFVYSPREGTPAARMEDNVSAEEKDQRLYRLNDLVNEYALKGNERFVGQIVDVLVDGDSKNGEDMMCGYTRHNKLCHLKTKNKDIVGQEVKVKVTEAKTWFIVGELVE